VPVQTCAPNFIVSIYVNLLRQRAELDPRPLPHLSLGCRARHGASSTSPCFFPNVSTRLLMSEISLGDLISNLSPRLRCALYGYHLVYIGAAVGFTGASPFPPLPPVLALLPHGTAFSLFAARALFMSSVLALRVLACVFSPLAPSPTARLFSHLERSSWVAFFSLMR
jgi:hypothetical protein